MQEQSNGFNNKDSNTPPLQMLFVGMLGCAIGSPRTMNVKQLLSALVHPHTMSRSTAEQVQQLEWLQDAAAVPLGPCPSAVWA